MNFRYLFLLFIAALTALNSCKNNDEVFKQVGTANINVINASTDILNFYLNGTRQNNTASLYPTGYSNYLPVPSGPQNYQFKLAGGFDVLFTVPLTLKDTSNYSLYVTGESASDSFSTADTLLKFIVDTTFLAQVRFVNASPDAGNLNVFIGDTVNFKNRAFKTSSVFSVVGSGLKRVQIFLPGASTPRIDTTIAMQVNANYTLFTKGLLNGKGNAAFDVGVVLNAQN